MVAGNVRFIRAFHSAHTVPYPLAYLLGKHLLPPDASKAYPWQRQLERHLLNFWR